MALTRIGKHWHRVGKRDPLAAILRHEQPSAQWEEGEFFAHGQQEVEALLEHLGLHDAPRATKKALDFGCGVGRTTQALAERFDEVAGVDIAPSMIERANAYNLFKDRCRYYLNKENDLSIFSDSEFDIVYSNRTLQHIEPEDAKRYIKEFIRVLNPTGIIVIQLAGEQVGEPPVQKQGGYFGEFLRAVLRPSSPTRLEARIRTFPSPKDSTYSFIESIGGRVLDITQDSAAGKGWTSYRYCIARA